MIGGKLYRPVADTFRVEVNVDEPDSETGAWRAASFVAEFTRRPGNGFEDLLTNWQRTKEGAFAPPDDVELLQRTLIGWSDVWSAAGKELSFNEANRVKLLNDIHVVRGLVRTLLRKRALLLVWRGIERAPRIAETNDALVVTLNEQDVEQLKFYADPQPGSAASLAWAYFRSGNFAQIYFNGIYRKLVDALERLRPRWLESHRRFEQLAYPQSPFSMRSIGTLSAQPVVKAVQRLLSGPRPPRMVLLGEVLQLEPAEEAILGMLLACATVGAAFEENREPKKREIYELEAALHALGRARARIKQRERSSKGGSQPRKSSETRRTAIMNAFLQRQKKNPGKKHRGWAKGIAAETGTSVTQVRTVIREVLAKDAQSGS